ncbi:hypothetical protein DFH09DRAFT_1073650 [Mycena vulgaris]|nr:hypothetical protein DFH09DRAFT_1073650 [Mycena vulgaris]
MGLQGQLILDRVRVNFGPLYHGLSGRIRSFDGSQLTVALPLEAPLDEQLPSMLAPDGSQTIEVPIENLNRHFLPGDHVVVVRGDRQNLHGLVIKVHTDSSLDLFTTRDGQEVLEDVVMGLGWTVKRHKTGCFNLVDLRVMRADVDFVIFDAENATSTVFQQYTRTAVVNEPRAQADDVEAYLAQQAGVAAATTKMVQLEPPATFAQLHSILQARDMLKVVFRHRDKGFWEQVTASFDTKERSNRLRVQQTSRHRCQYLEGDMRGIMLTIKNEHNNQVIVPIENVIHDFYFLVRTCLPLVQARYLPLRVLYASRLMTPSSPKPRPCTPTPLPQESNPQWGLERSTEEEQQRVAREREQESLQQRLAFKYNQQRLPAELDGSWLGTASLESPPLCPSRRIREISAEARASEGPSGVVILTEAVSDFRVGQKQHKIVFPPSCIKPRQDHPEDGLITKRVDRVIVLGPDVVGDTSLVGSYTQTQPEIMHPHGDDVVGVRRTDGSGPFFFHILRLCLSKNEMVGECKSTVFPQ